jgi:predicted transcriptional regulator
MDREPEQVRKNLRDLEREGFIIRKGKNFRIAN